MSISRAILLIAGPFMLVSLSYWMTMGGANERPAASTRFDPLQNLRTRFASAFPAASLEKACQQSVEALRPRLSSQCHIIVRTPFVIAGDLPEAELDRYYRATIQPTVRALSTCYFDHPPDQPVTILMFLNDRTYREHAQHLDGRSPTVYSGYYERPDRRVMLNIATGDGTLAHELTHALAHFDFPNMPEWFDEGLASLHEESRFSDDGLKLQGASNWRLRYLLDALHFNRLRPLEALIASDGIRSDQQAVDYAHARYFCLYLQQRGLLSHYYRKFRTLSHDDPTGALSLLNLLGADSLQSIDTDFRRWIQSLSR